LVLTIISVCKRIPAWVDQAWQDYVKRLPKTIRINLIEVRPYTHSDKTIQLTKEAQKMEPLIPKDTKIIALAVEGMLWTPQFSQSIVDETQDICFLIGGPIGLSQKLLTHADIILSLSRLTLPHALVRIILIEQIYRASLPQDHPYHK
jgi:23S rRNA (pseudouridine1915-N3)-methyltransferase